MKNIYKSQILLFILLLTFIITPTNNTTAQLSALAEKLSGKILLQVENAGEAWYVNPANNARYYLGRPSDAFTIMRELGTGITNNDLKKIAIGMIGDNFQNLDNDSDGYTDYEEIINDYDPFGSGKLIIDEDFAIQSRGKIFLQVEQNGEAWYVNPGDNKRYYLGRPIDAFNIMRSLGLGITNQNLKNIDITAITSISDQADDTSTTTDATDKTNISPISAQEAIDGAADAIRSRNASKAIKYFTPEMEKSIEYNLKELSNESILALGNILSGSKITSSTNTEKTFTNDIYFTLGGQYVKLEFHVRKELNGNWYLVNL